MFDWPVLNLMPGVNDKFAQRGHYIIAIPQLTPSLPEYLMEFCKATLTFESAECDHSNESSLPVLSHGAICFSKF